MFPYFYKFSLFILFSVALYGQSPRKGIGNWRTHFTYSTAESIAESDDFIYCSSPYSFYSVNKDDGSFKLYSRMEGLSDVSITLIKYNDQHKFLFIVYSNGNIDIMKDGEIININDIKRKELIGSKRVNHIDFYDKYAFLACDFGLVIVDCIRFEVKESIQSFSKENQQLIVKSSTIFNDSIYIATDKGLLHSPYNTGINLMDFRNWRQYSINEGIPTGEVISIAQLEDKIFTYVANSGIYYKTVGNWNSLPGIGSEDKISFIKNSKGRIIIGGSSRINYLYPDFTITYDYRYPSHPNDALLDNTGYLWIADMSVGLLTNRYSNEYNPAVHIPSGPFKHLTWDLNYFDGKIISVPGGHNSGITNTQPGAYYIFENENWYNYDISKTFDVNVFDLVTSFYEPNNKNLFLGSFQTGLIKIGPDTTIRYDETNSTIVPSYSRHPFITDISSDGKGNIWFLNISAADKPGTDPALYFIKPNGSWGEPISLNHRKANYLTHLVVDNTGNKWMGTIPEKDEGMLIYNEERGLKVLTSGNMAGLPSNKIYAMTMDKSEQLWVGTDKGIGIFYDPGKIFSGSTAIQPRVDGFPLLMDQIITCIEVDGGNRKWIGTRNGVWLFTPDGLEAIEYFNMDNSPLPSNIIRDVEVHEKTGEVFIATDMGIVSYWGTSTEGEDNFSDVKVFPNPVKSNFSGQIGITGLAGNVNIKITDIFGNLMYETKAEGGMAVWNGRNYKGIHAKSGLYLVFCSDDEGEAKLVTKFSILE